MILNKLTPALTVDNIRKTISFFTEALGFELALAVPNRESVDWALIKCGDIEIMLRNRVGNSPGKVNEYEGVALHCEGEGVRQLYESIKDKVQIVRHLYPTFYGTY
jgi:uncharacterized glyoxalase superfamily protein PhnB